MCIDFLFQNFGQKVVEIISTVLKSCLSKVCSLFLDPKKPMINKKDTRPALDCGFMYCLMQCNIKLTSGCHVSLFQESITEAQLRFLVSMCHDLPTDTRAGILILLWEFFYKKMVGTSLLNI